MTRTLWFTLRPPGSKAVLCLAGERAVCSVPMPVEVVKAARTLATGRAVRLAVENRPTLRRLERPDGSRTSVLSFVS